MTCELKTNKSKYCSWKPARLVRAYCVPGTAREIGTKLLIGNFNGLPVIDSSIKVIGIVTISSGL